jgi:hypothetical protein
MSSLASTASNNNNNLHLDDLVFSTERDADDNRDDNNSRECARSTAPSSSSSSSSLSSSSAERTSSLCSRHSATTGHPGRLHSLAIGSDSILVRSNRQRHEHEHEEAREIARNNILQKSSERQRRRHDQDGNGRGYHLSQQSASLSCLWGSGRLPGLLDGECSPTVPVDIAHPVFRGKRIVQTACAMGSRQALFLTAGGDVYRSGGGRDSDMFPAEGDPAETSVMVEWGGTVRADPVHGSGSVGRRGRDGQLEMKIREPRLVQDFAWERALQRCTIVSVACGEVRS